MYTLCIRTGRGVRKRSLTRFCLSSRGLCFPVGELACRVRARCGGRDRSRGGRCRGLLRHPRHVRAFPAALGVRRIWPPLKPRPVPRVPEMFDDDCTWLVLLVIPEQRQTNTRYVQRQIVPSTCTCTPGVRSYSKIHCVCIYVVSCREGLRTSSALLASPHTS